MRRGLIIFLTLAAGLPAAVRADPGPPPPPVLPELPPHFMCSVTHQEGPLGEVGVQQLVNMDGTLDTRLDSWSIALAPEGVSIQASWEHPDPARYSLVWLTQIGLDSGRSYRVRVQREPPSGDRDLRVESPLLRPDDDGSIAFHTHWEVLTAMLGGAPDPRILVIRDDGTVIRSDPINPALFARALAATMPLQAELDAKLADYRRLCPYFEGGPIVPPTVVQVPG